MPDSALLVPPAVKWVPEYDVTYGDLVADLAATVSIDGRPMVMDPEQRMILDATYAEDAPGVPTCFEVGTVAPRQNIKTAVLQVAALADIEIFRVGLHVWTAHLFKTSTSAFEGLVKMIDSNPEISRNYRPPRTSNGKESIERRTGERIEFHARSERGGRGLTGHRVTLDEGLYLRRTMVGALIPILATIPGAQVRYGSSAGVIDSDVLRELRARGIAGGDPSLAYFEWAARRKPCADERCDHRDVEDPGCALNDRELWAEANVALGRRIPESFIAKARRAMAPEEFAREWLGWWDEAPEDVKLIDLAAWRRAAVEAKAPASVITSRPMLAIEVSLDRTKAAVGLAGYRADGRVQLELAAYGRGVAWVVERVKAMLAKTPTHGVMVDPGSPAGSLITALREAGIEPITVTSRELAQACGKLKSDVEDVDEADPDKPPAVAHVDEQLLNDAVDAVQPRDLAGGMAFDRESYGADTIPLLAVTLAKYGLELKGLDAPPNIW